MTFIYYRKPKEDNEMANNIEEMIKSSKCFGIAFDGSVKECKICEVRLKCENKCRLGVGETPQKPDSVNIADKDEVSSSDEAAAKSAAKEKDKTAKKPTKTKEKTEVQYSEEMPDFKAMSIEELAELLNSRGGDASEFDKYDKDAIKRMRMTMAIKKTYEVK